MSLNPEQSTGGGNFIKRTLPKEGKNTLRNYGVVDLGKHAVVFEGKPTLDKAGNQLYQSQVSLLFEFPKVLQSIKEGEPQTPFIISQDYSFIASDRSKLCKVLKSWGRLKENPKQLNLKPYLGQYCEANIIHKAKASDSSSIFANINDGGRDISPIDKTIEIPDESTPTGTKVVSLVEADGRTPKGCKAYNKDIWFDLDHFNWEQFKTLPKLVQDKIRKCQEWPTIIAKNPEPQDAIANTGYNPYAQQNTIADESAPVSMGDDTVPAF